MTILPDGTPKEFVSVNEKVVTDFEEKVFDPALFEVPAGFHEVNSIKRNPPVLVPGSRWTKLKNWFDDLF